jgi:hypothetical protein
MCQWPMWLETRISSPAGSATPDICIATQSEGPARAALVLQPVQGALRVQAARHAVACSTAPVGMGVPLNLRLF